MDIVDYEKPDQSIVCAADSFCEIALELSQRVASGELSSAIGMLVNAALAIELYLKALQVHWKSSQEMREPTIVSVPDKKGHDLGKLFEALHATDRDRFESAFRSHPVFHEIHAPDLKCGISRIRSLYETLKDLALTFENERYFFERVEKPRRLYHVRVLPQICQLVRDTVKVMEVERGQKQLESSNDVPIRIHYMEIVTDTPELTCQMFSEVHGVTFADADPVLGNARTARLANGGTLGVRGPSNDAEKLVVRPYVKVKDIEAAVKAAEAVGALIVVSPMQRGSHGTSAIYIHSGIETGLWQP